MGLGLWMAFVSLYVYVSFVIASDNQTIAEAFPELAGFNPTGRASFSTPVGGRDAEQCCKEAIYDSLKIINGRLVFQNSSDIRIDQDSDDFRRRPWPCGAKYDGDRRGTTSVSISYRRCAARCGSWQLSKTNKLNEWVSPLIGFVLPAIVFCLAIPRRRRINIPAALFDIPLDNFSGLPKLPLYFCLAAILAVVDTIVWLMIIFALAGPILVSGVYEARLDRRIIKYINDKIESGVLSVAQRAHLLLVILVGNIDMNFDPDTFRGDECAWNHLIGRGSLIYSLRPLQPIPNVKRMIDDSNVAQAKTRLRTLLAAQYSFGVIVGAAVVFFCGSFLYTMVDNSAHLGDNNVSHALAFGTWWMTIPHIGK